MRLCYLFGKTKRATREKKYFYFFQNVHTLLAKACIYKHVPNKKTLVLC